MSVVVSGAELGLANVRIQGAQGQGIQGQAGVGVYINATTGNLVLQQQDQILVGQGIDAGLIRTYNSQGQYADDNNDNFRFLFNQRLLGLSGSINAAGSRITRVAGDGSESAFVYDSVLQLYVSDEGQGAHDTLFYSDTTAEWVHTEGSSQQQEIYNWDNGQGRLIRRLDTDNNATTYSYHSNGFINRITDASGQVMDIIYSGNNATEVMTTSQGTTQTLVRYSYDDRNRLTQVSIDLTPEDNSVADNHTYLTHYTYEGDSNRIESISQSDGTRTAFTYDAEGRVSTVTDGENNITSYHYTNEVDSTTQPISTAYSLNTTGFISPEPLEQDSYYPIPSGATWADIAQSLYGTSESDLIEQLHIALGTTDVESLSQIEASDLPETLLVYRSATSVETLNYDLDSSAFVDAEWVSATYSLQAEYLQNPIREESGELIFRSLSGVAEQNGALSKIAEDGWAEGYFESQETVATNADGWMEFTIDDLASSSYGIGFAASDAGQYTPARFRFWVEGGAVSIFESGAWVHGLESYQVGDVLRIERQNGLVHYSQNGQVVYTSAENSTEELRLAGFFYSQGTSVSSVNASFVASDSSETPSNDLSGAYYSVQAGDTWESIASLLYGSSSVANQLQAQFEGISLEEGSELNGLPDVLVENDTTAPTSVDPYYRIPDGATWAPLPTFVDLLFREIGQLAIRYSSLGFT